MTNEEFIQSITLDGEEWRDVVEYEDLYLVSNFGRICCIRTTIEDKKRNRRTRQKISKVHTVNRNGKLYAMVVLTKDGVSKKKYLHQIIAQAFIPNPHKYNEIDHIDRNGLNNNLNNLRWCSHKENQRNPNTRKAMSQSHIGKPNMYKRKKIVQLDGYQIVRIYDMMTDVEKYGFSRTAITNSIKNKHKSGGYNWMYLSDYESLANQ